MSYLIKVKLIISGTKLCERDGRQRRADTKRTRETKTEWRMERQQQKREQKERATKAQTKEKEERRH